MRLIHCSLWSENKHGGRREAEEELFLKQGASSTIWNWFGYRKSGEGQTTAICKFCRKTVAAKSKNTSDLFHHLKHKPEYEECLKIRETMQASTTSGPISKIIPTQIKIANAFANCVQNDKQSNRWVELTEAVALCLTKDMSLQIVKEGGF